ncbi:Cytosolic phospholipase A2 [Paramyrothecium foliicola]|nr:Cytosolic phospholipase A2 [Paramyrothecium foliicola]
MVILTAIRQSPAYLYVKTYCLCALVTLFQTAPVTSRLPRIGERLQLNKYQIVSTRLGPRVIPVDVNELHQTQAAAKNDPKAAAPSAPAVKDLIISPELIGPWAKDSRVHHILKRWYRRAVDLSQVKQLLRRDDSDVRAYPELEWDATVRRSSALHVEERRFIELRKHRISSQGANSLHHLLDLPKDEKVDPRDVPLIALGGSGGGYRSMYGFAAFISASKKLGLWDCVTWVAGVSGTCWTLAAYYTIAYQDVARLTQHYLSMAKELAHPMSVLALNTVARSSKGVYFLIGPLVRKAQNNIIGLSVMDLYATLTTTYQFISREPRARLSRATFQWSKVWKRSGIDRGLEPMPFLTAVRKAPKNSTGVKPHTDSSISKGQPPELALAQHQMPVADALMSRRPRKMQRADSYVPPGFFQWFEVSPLEIGSPDARGYIPTWAWGRTFAAGQSIGRAPEQSLSLMLGQCTSAPAGPLTAYIDALLASMPKGTAMSRALMMFNNFIRSNKLSGLWGNPIRAGHDPNPFYGLNSNPSSRAAVDDAELLGIGVSSFDTSRLSRLSARKGGSRSLTSSTLDKLAQRILNDQELDEFAALKSSLDRHKDVRHSIETYLSVAWSLKVATHRALRSHYSVSWRDIVVTSASNSLAPDAKSLSNSDMPRINMSSQWMASTNGLHDAHVPVLRPSFSHDHGKIVATVIAEKGPALPPADQTELLQAEQASDPVTKSTSNNSLASSSTTPNSKTSATISKPPSPPWESQGRVRLLDSGMSNNLPNHIFARPERGADILLAFDASSDVQLGSAVRRLQNFADDCGLGELEEQTDLFEPLRPHFARGLEGNSGDSKAKDAEVIENQFMEQYAKVFHGMRETGEDVFVVYCPLLPNGTNPGFNPSTASFSNSFNLVWTPSQIKTLFATSEANLTHYAIHMIKQVTRKVYENKKARRLGLSSARAVGESDTRANR